MSRHAALAVVLTLGLASACGSSDEGDGAGGSSGAAGSSGSGASGGSAGSTSTGGSSGSGASGGSAGSTSTGGSAGSTATGGSAGSATGGSAGAAGSAGSSGSAGAAGVGGVGGAGGSGGSSGNSAAVKIIAIGDTGEGNVDQGLVADQMDKKCAAVGGCTAVMMTGDNFYDHGVQSTSDTQWTTKFEQIYDRPNLNGLKFYATLGNHDYGATSSGKKEAQIQYSSLPVGTGAGTRSSDKWVMYDAYYDKRLPDDNGSVHIFSIDTQDYSGTQKTAMSNKVKASTATWKIVFGHHPRYTSGEHYWDNQLLGLLGMFSLQESIFCSGADMFLTGHDHNVELIDKGRHSACPNVWFMISGAGAKVRSSNAPKDSKSLYYDESIEALAYLEFVGNTLKVEFIDKNGKLLFTKTITK